MPWKILFKTSYKPGDVKERLWDNEGRRSDYSIGGLISIDQYMHMDIFFGNSEIIPFQRCNLHHLYRVLRPVESIVEAKMSVALGSKRNFSSKTILIFCHRRENSGFRETL